MNDLARIITCPRCGDFIEADCFGCSKVSVEDNSLVVTAIGFVLLIFAMQILTIVMSVVLAPAANDSILEVYIALWLGPMAILPRSGLSFSAVLPHIILDCFFILSGLVVSSSSRKNRIALIFTVFGFLLWIGAGLDALMRIY